MRVSFLLLCLTALLPVTTLASERGDFFRSCTVQGVDEEGSVVTVFNRDRKRIDYSEALVIAVKEGEEAEAVIRCDTEAVHNYFGKLPEGKHYDVRLGANPGRPHDGGGLNRKKAIVPVKAGLNEVVVTSQDVNYPQVGAFSKRLQFYAFVYKIEPAGRLHSPFDDKNQNLKHFITDRQGKLYGVASSKKLKKLMRFSSSGRLEVNYDLGKPDPKYGNQGSPKPLFVDSQGHLFVALLSNIIEYDRKGKFVKSYGSFGLSGRIRTAADLDAGTKRKADREQGSDWGKIVRSSGYHPVVIRDWVYFVGEISAPKGESGTRKVVIRFSLDGTLEVVAVVAGTSTPYRNISGMTTAPDGTLHVKVTGDKWLSAILSVSPGDGTVKKIKTLPAGNKLPPEEKSLASSTRNTMEIGDSTGYYFEGKRVLRDLSWGAGFAIDSHQLRYRKPKGKRGGERIDLLSGEQTTSAKSHWKKTYWYHRKTPYVLYKDMRIAKFTLQGDGGFIGIGDTIQAKTKSELKDSLVIVRNDSEMGSAVVLNGEMVVSGEVEFLNHRGNPKVETPIEFSLWEQLPKNGELTFPKGKVTNSDGKVIFQYITPYITSNEMAAGKWAPEIRITASAKGRKGELIEEQVRFKLLGVTEVAMQVIRPGFVEPGLIPISVPNPTGGVVKGAVQFHVGKGVFGGMTLPEYLPVNSAFVMLLEGDEVIGEAITDNSGQFELVFGKEVKADQENLTILEEPLLLKTYDKDISYFVNNIRTILNEMEKKRYGYSVTNMRALLQGHFPQLISSAANQNELNSYREQLVSVGLLLAALREADDLAKHAGEQFADSLVNVMDGLRGLTSLDPLDNDRMKIKGMSKKAGEDAAYIALTAGDGVKQRVAQFVFSKLKQNFIEVQRGMSAHHQHVAWYWLKKILMKGVVDISSKSWKERLVSGLMENYRTQAQSSINRLATAWRENRVNPRQESRLAIRHRYAEIAEFKQQTTTTQLNLELYKADIDLGFDVIGQGIVVFATIKGGPTAGDKAAKGVEMIDKGFKALTTGAEAYTGFQWLRDYDGARSAISDFSKAVIGN